jgi:hypothetical protein
MTLNKLKIIYEPKGPAREYAALALNLYNGCTHGCIYCYNNGRYTKPGEFFKASKPRQISQGDLSRDCAILRDKYGHAEYLPGSAQCAHYFAIYNNSRIQTPVVLAAMYPKPRAP